VSVISQLQFSGMPERQPPGHRTDSGVLPGVTEQQVAVAKYLESPGMTNWRNKVDDSYTSAHLGGRWPGGGGWKPNPIAAYDHNWEMHRGQPIESQGEEFIPPWRTTSLQDDINEAAVQHQLQNANPLALDEEPSVSAYPGQDGHEWYRVIDGNHRTNAAQRRGQLLMPAEVARRYS
jgi:hypothetical protein